MPVGGVRNAPSAPAQAKPRKPRGPRQGLYVWLKDANQATALIGMLEDAGEIGWEVDDLILRVTRARKRKLRADGLEP